MIAIEHGEIDACGVICAPPLIHNHLIHKHLTWAGLWLVKGMFYIVWVKILLLEKLVYTSRFRVPFSKFPES
jgi:hypothetical protein